MRRPAPAGRIVRFSDLDGAAIGVWGAGREIAAFAAELERLLPAARIVAAAFDAPPSPAEREALRSPGARIVAGGEAVRALRECELVVRSPGVSIHRPELRALRDAGTPVTTATSLWLEEHGGEGVLGVSGTKGKSTTAALAGHLARAAGRTVALAGNIGVPAIELLSREPAQVVVLELSSYQIADLSRGPEVALMTNLFREHVDWHGSERAYREDKLRLLALPGVRGAVLNGREDAGLLAALDGAPRRPGGGAPRLAGGGAPPPAQADRLGLGVETVLYGVPGGFDVRDGAITRAGGRIASTAELPLRGEHNALNLCGALAGLQALGVQAPLPLGRALAGFEPLAHRLEEVAERDGVLWVNDSISTTPESTLAALASFPGRRIVLIAGGQDREQDYAQLARAIAAGEASLIAVPTTGTRLLEAARAAGAPQERLCEARDLAEAIERARARARPGEVVLLSPAAPSYDHYRDFEQRGERFRALARA
ncbi:MAG TPA: UDP-N-acetylmuramoyl-L-alanine--D-glutamate ligase [Solirubrobacteraceae bacterium]|nr:UDP-N-acetylmuramoyl-L-alanine--D-glutamate ligase [Solirubrobacteraceae bacterium]